MTNLTKLLVKKYNWFRYHWIRRWTPILWPNSIYNYPFKCRRMPELTDQFLAERQVHRLTNPCQPLSVDGFRSLSVDQKSEDVIETVVNEYNRRLKTKFYPSTVTLEDMKYMIVNDLNYYRLKRHLDFLFIREFDIWRSAKLDAEKRALRHSEREQQMAAIKTIGCFDDQNSLQYGFWRNTMFTRYYQKALKRYSLHNLRVATMFGQQVVIDCSFDREMQEYEVQSVGRQMAKIYHMNRLQSRQSFDLHFCNCDPESRVMKNFFKYLGSVTESDKRYCLNIHEESYQKLFPNRRLIYLSPDAKQVMEEFDHNAIYILGSLVGKTCRLPLTKWKASAEGLECYKFPIHKYVQLNPLVKKTLSFQGSFKILLELQDHNDWQLAFKNGIQEHKIKNSNQQ